VISIAINTSLFPNSSTGTHQPMKHLIHLLLLVFAVVSTKVSGDIILTSSNPDTQNGGFEDIPAFKFWRHDSSSLSTNASYAHTGTHSAQIGTADNSKTYLEQIVQTSTLQGNYTFSFWVKNSANHNPLENQLDVEFNHIVLAGSIPIVGPTNKWPIRNVDFPVYTFFKFAGVPALYVAQTALIPDLRIRFHGQGFVLDDVTVTRK